MIWRCSSPLNIRIPGLHETVRSRSWIMVNYVVENRTTVLVRFVPEIGDSPDCLGWPGRRQLRRSEFLLSAAMEAIAAGQSTSPIAVALIRSPPCGSWIQIFQPLSMRLRQIWTSSLQNTGDAAR